MKVNIKPEQYVLPRYPIDEVKIELSKQEFALLYHLGNCAQGVGDLLATSKKVNPTLRKHAHNVEALLERIFREAQPLLNELTGKQFHGERLLEEVVSEGKLSTDRSLHDYRI